MTSSTALANRAPFTARPVPCRTVPQKTRVVTAAAQVRHARVGLGRSMRHILNGHGTLRVRALAHRTGVGLGAGCNKRVWQHELCGKECAARSRCLPTGNTHVGTTMPGLAVPASCVTWGPTVPACTHICGFKRRRAFQERASAKYQRNAFSIKRLV